MINRIDAKVTAGGIMSNQCHPFSNSNFQNKLVVNLYSWKYFLHLYTVKTLNNCVKALKSPTEIQIYDIKQKGT